jgi:diapolycopene oxygenase
MTETRAGRIGVIGGGLGGLAAACTLAARGYRVVVFEKNPWLGGKAAVLQQAGYRFDMGPTILTLPSVLRRIFGEAQRKLADSLNLVRIDPQWRSFFSDGATLDLVADLPAMVANLDSFAPGSGAGDGYRRFIDFSAKLHDISDRFFFWRSIGSLWDMADARTLIQPSMLGAVFNLRLGKSVAQCVRSHVAEPRVAQMLDHFTQYVGSAPDASPAVLCALAHMQTQEGVWYPEGGIGAVPQALAKLATDLGVELRTGVGVRRIVLDDDGAAAGVETEAGETVPLAAVVSNADSVRTHRELLSGTKAAQRFERRRGYEPSCSGVVLYLGLDRAYEHLAHHNFVFSRDAHEEFDFVYRRGEPAPDPTCYVAAPARTEPGVAPPGGEALYVLVHTPYLRPHHDWDKLYPAYRRVILDKLVKTAGLSDLDRRIRFEAKLTPVDIAERYRVLDGAIYGLASHGKWTGAFKPANRSPDVRGLYLAGVSAHPGPGMPMALMSGWIAADALDKDGAAERGAATGAERAAAAAPAVVPAPAPAMTVVPRRSPSLVRLLTR